MNKIKISVLFLILLPAVFIGIKHLRSDKSVLMIDQKMMIENLSIESKIGVSIKFEQKNGTWILNGKYKADEIYLGKLIEKLRKLKSAKAIASSGYERFGLSEDNRFHITAGDAKNEVSFYIGKNSSGNYFIMKEENGKIYLAENIKSNDLIISEDSARDKQIYKVKPSEVAKITVTKSKTEILLPEEKDGKIVYSLQGKNISSDNIEIIVNDIQDFRADKFIDIKPSGKSEASVKLFLKNGKEIGFEIFPKEKNNLYPVVSTESEYAFYISPHRAERIMNLDVLK
ncbi:MAG TPA: DUF4340 domain-containing protein [Spirochaetota bacterium]|jgi:hypothetical protein|nr:DUF4340 domain-containing protein [Spirochaetota bacterium]HOH37186.1 DUF4340 domain-containing protein [Spirochaetota bacterium]HPJ13640.1 DUF4340 domain-containing protein [Spirochaetota bacterium]HPM33041.1 DUF4340 domain-containing protein [Spirochaetota bacterium]HPY02043.1 DUF4340 domain-containing protein [Spirochaetota bacterium]